MERYFARHNIYNRWGVEGVGTPGFYSKWVSWNKQTLKETINDMETCFTNYYLKT